MMSSEPPVMVFDGMNLAYTAYYAYSKLRGSEILYGAPEMIRAFIFRYNPNKVLVVWDGARHPDRMELLPTYKSHRKERPKEVDVQIKKVMKLLYYMGIPQIVNEDIEGDDMMYLVVQRLKKQTDAKIRVISGDKDMLQMVDDRVWIEGMGQNRAITTKALFMAHTSLKRPDMHVDYLCLVGDKSDDIPGYLGIGEARAREFLNKWGSIKAFLADKTNRHPLIKRKRLRKLWKRNRALIDLKFFCEKQGYTSKDITYFRDRREPLFNEEKFIMLCQRYRLKVFQQNSFKNIFKRLS